MKQLVSFRACFFFYHLPSSSYAISLVTVIATLAPLTALEVDSVARSFQSAAGKPLVQIIESETGGWLRSESLLSFL